MAERGRSRFNPDYCLPPGAHLEEVIEAVGMKQSELARRTGLTPKTINEIVKGKQAVTPQTALQFEKVFGTPASYWNNLEGHYRELLAREKEKKVLQNPTIWLSRFPLKEMIKEGMVRNFKNNLVEQARELLKFFGVASIAAYFKTWEYCQVKFRISAVREINDSAVYAWLRQGEKEAREIECEAYDGSKFKRALMEIRLLTVKKPDPFSKKMVELCADSGVAVVFRPSLPNMGVSGATRWLASNKALIQLCLRYGTNDHFWFSFYHEAAHILMHGKKNVYLEIQKKSESYKVLTEPKNFEERQANDFAAEMLIPKDKYNEFLPPYTEERIISFARQIRIHPGIVVGRLQHDGKIDYSWQNNLKNQLMIIRNVN